MKTMWDVRKIIADAKSGHSYESNSNTMKISLEMPFKSEHEINLTNNLYWHSSVSQLLCHESVCVPSCAELCRVVPSCAELCRVVPTCHEVKRSMSFSVRRAQSE